ncbi:hypothetical protein S7711_08374 [Stachybotrys chartarum IBT 7711]|uniref:Uncharacterized protein n=1 Tax=Stachybotrys chartarum (strain CBS 109288 / IBT 7711) TaxID=1280523 RepID=A0A084ART6_STACB|nr:hypothetical protein S7711_08374 [Stachybotrys chartarum IBT 7711]
MSKEKKKETGEDISDGGFDWEAWGLGGVASAGRRFGGKVKQRLVSGRQARQRSGGQSSRPGAGGRDSPPAQVLRNPTALDYARYYAHAREQARREGRRYNDLPRPVVTELWRNGRLLGLVVGIPPGVRWTRLTGPNMSSSPSPPRLTLDLGAQIIPSILTETDQRIASIDRVLVRAPRRALPLPFVVSSPGAASSAAFSHRPVPAARLSTRNSILRSSRSGFQEALRYRDRYVDDDHHPPAASQSLHDISQSIYSQQEESNSASEDDTSTIRSHHSPPTLPCRSSGEPDYSSPGSRDTMISDLRPAPLTLYHGGNGFDRAFIDAEQTMAVEPTHAETSNAETGLASHWDPVQQESRLEDTIRQMGECYRESVREKAAARRAAESEELYYATPRRGPTPAQRAFTNPQPVEAIITDEPLAHIHPALRDDYRKQMASARATGPITPWGPQRHPARLTESVPRSDSPTIPLAVDLRRVEAFISPLTYTAEHELRPNRRHGIVQPTALEPGSSVPYTPIIDSIRVATTGEDNFVHHLTEGQSVLELRTISFGMGDNRIINQRHIAGGPWNASIYNEGNNAESLELLGHGRASNGRHAGQHTPLGDGDGTIMSEEGRQFAASRFRNVSGPSATNNILLVPTRIAETSTTTREHTSQSPRQTAAEKKSKRATEKSPETPYSLSSPSSQSTASGRAQTPGRNPSGRMQKIGQFISNVYNPPQRNPRTPRHDAHQELCWDPYSNPPRYITQAELQAQRRQREAAAEAQAHGGSTNNDAAQNQEISHDSGISSQTADSLGLRQSRFNVSAGVSSPVVQRAINTPLPPSRKSSRVISTETKIAASSPTSEASPSIGPQSSRSRRPSHASSSGSCASSLIPATGFYTSRSILERSVPARAATPIPSPNSPPRQSPPPRPPRPSEDQIPEELLRLRTVTHRIELPQSSSATAVQTGESSRTFWGGSSDTSRHNRQRVDARMQDTTQQTSSLHIPVRPATAADQRPYHQRSATTPTTPMPVSPTASNAENRETDEDSTRKAAQNQHTPQSTQSGLSVAKRSDGQQSDTAQAKSPEVVRQRTVTYRPTSPPTVPKTPKKYPKETFPFTNTATSSKEHSSSSAVSSSSKSAKTTKTRSRLSSSSSSTNTLVQPSSVAGTSSLMSRFNTTGLGFRSLRLKASAVDLFKSRQDSGSSGGSDKKPAKKE